MAGIGFELRKLLRDNTFLGLARAYGYAGIISAGPWVISIFGIIGLNFLKYFKAIPAATIQDFQISITYLIALSLIFSGFTQHSFTRYVSDRIYEKKFSMIIPSYNGLLLLLIIASGAIGWGIAMLFHQQDLFYKILFASSFVILCAVWYTSNLLSGLKAYRMLLFVFFIGYGLTILLDYFLRAYFLDGLMLGFFIGQFVLLFGMMITLYQYYPSHHFISFDFLKKGRTLFSLVFVSIFYNLGIWVDKFIFWYAPFTSHHVIGPLRASMIYDVPIFLAYITIIPGMAIFLFRMETDFVEYYQQYYTAIEKGDTLFNIMHARYQLTDVSQKGLIDIARFQGITIFIVFALGPQILSWLRISKHFIYLLNIDVVGTSLLVLFLALMNILFYFARCKEALLLSILFFVLNLGFTLLTLHLGVFYFGYGFVMALLIVDIIAAILLDRDFNNLEYKTFMNY